jgi:hypothetical protein
MISNNSGVGKLNNFVFGAFINHSRFVLYGVQSGSCVVSPPLIRPLAEWWDQGAVNFYGSPAFWVKVENRFVWKGKQIEHGHRNCFGRINLQEKKERTLLEIGVAVLSHVLKSQTRIIFSLILE